jgi:glycosyltransferase involved in cell wall biosynthesis
MYKGADILLEALAECRARGRILKAEFIGGGRALPHLQELSSRLGLENQVTWLGWLPAGRPVSDRLDAADLFVMPSKTEGLPKAMIEAMARALPCIGSKVGGIPELLSSEDLFPPGDPLALADKLMEIVDDPGRMTQMSARNLAAAWEYSEEELRTRHQEFYRRIRQLSADIHKDRKSCY